jgi:LacI family transcriptional regulator
VTITDVARLAGVSPGTASKALNGRGGISADTVERVRQAAERLGYQPNALARGLLTGRSFTVGLITTDSFGRFSIPVMQGAEDALGPGRIAVLLCDSRDDQIREQHYLRTLLERRVDGIIVTGRRQDPREPIGSDIPVPVVYAMTSSTNPGDLSLVPDDAEGGAIAVRHLLSTGRTRIGHVTGPMSFVCSRLRADGAERQGTAPVERLGHRARRDPGQAGHVGDGRRVLAGRIFARRHRVRLPVSMAPTPGCSRAI